MLRWTITIAVCFLIGVGLMLVAEAIGGATGWLVAAFLWLSLTIAQQVYCQLIVPRRIRDAYYRQLNPSAGPPAGAEPVDSDLMRRLASARDWDEVSPLLTKDFAMIDTRGRRCGVKAYKRMNEGLAQFYPDLAIKVEAIVADPADPHVLYLRQTVLGRPRRGPLLHTTIWTRCRLAPGHQQVRELELTGVLSVA